MRIDDKQEKSSTTSSPQASPGSTVCGNGGNNNNSISSGKANGQNGRIWSIVGDMEDRQENSQVTRNWSPLRQEEKEILRDKTRTMDLGQTIIPDDHMHSKSESDPQPRTPNRLLSSPAELESDARSLDERSDAASSGNETSVDVEVEVI